MRVFHRDYKCSEAFTPRSGETWCVQDPRGKLVERWSITAARNGWFRVKITEYVKEDRS